MNNKSFLKMMGRSIKGSMSRFIAIVGITALGAGFLAGLLATSPDMKESSNEYFENAGLYDFYVQSTLGFSEDDITAINKEPYVNEIMAIDQKDEFVQDEEGENLETRVFRMNLADKNLLNKVELMKGRMPENSRECLIEVPNHYSYDAEVGRKYKDEDGKTYTATGIVRSPLFISTNGEPTNIGKGSIALGMYINSREKPEIYTAVYARTDVKNRDTFSDEYKDELDVINDKFEAFGKVQVRERHDQIVAEAQEKLDKNRNKFKKEKRKALNRLDDAKQELVSNEEKLDSGMRDINSGFARIDDGFDQISDGQMRIADGKRQLTDGINKIDRGISQINDGMSQLEPGIEQLKDAIAQLESQLEFMPPEQQGAALEQLETMKGQLQEYEGQYKELSNKKKELKEQRRELKDKKEQLNAQEENLKNKKVALINTKADLTDKKSRINEGREELEKGWNKYRDEKDKAEKEFDKAEKKLKKAEKKIDDIEDGEWIISSRLDSTGVNSYLSDIDKIRAIANIFPVFFFIVAALVVLTTMTRMIEEERGQVGTLKSLGYDNRIIRKYYLFYGAFATLVGSTIGLCSGFIILPKVISNAYNMMYNLPITETPFRWDLGIFIALVTLLFVTVTILFACRNELKEKPASLLQPKAPEAGKRIFLERITPLWNRLKFTRKVTLRNLFRYKKRFLMTIIGVAGCFALLLTGFGIRDSISDIVDLQFGEITRYDVNVALDDGKWNPDLDIYDEVGMFSTGNVTLKHGDKTETVNLTVPQDEESLKTFVDLRERKSKEKYNLQDGQLLLSEKLTEICDIKKGDTVTIEKEGKDDVTMKVTGFFENYVGNVAYISPETYRDIFNEEADFNTVYMNIKDSHMKNKDMDDVVSEIMEEDNVKFAMATDTIRKNFNDSVKNIDYIVWVLIICAGALSVIVLYNLTNINICERKKELATIKVLGFFNREVRAYIFREVYLLSFIGIFAGIPCGHFLHRFVVKTAEVGGMMFGRSIYPDSFVLAIVITIAFTVLVSFIMRRSIMKINMVESMKATD